MIMCNQMWGMGRQVKYFPGVMIYVKEKISEVAKYKWKDLKAAEGNYATSI